MRDIQSVQIATLLGRIPLFAGLSPDENARLALATRCLNLEKQAVLFRPGDPCQGLYLVVSGQLKLAFMSPQGTDKVVDVVGQGGSFGDSFMFLEQPYPYYAQALQDSQLLHVAASALEAEMARDPAFMRKMLGNMARQLHEVVGDVESYALHSGERRVVGYLMRQLDDSQLEADAVVIDLPTIKGVIASRINLTHEHFARILQSLTRRGLLQVNGRQVQIPSVARLLAEVEA